MSGNRIEQTGDRVCLGGVKGDTRVFHKLPMIALLFVSLVGFTLAQGRPGAFSSQALATQEATEPVPAFHPAPSRQPLPAAMDPKAFPDALNQNVYAMAGKVKSVLYQQPCYCHCDQHVGHQSLLDCFVDAHGSMCAVCKSEAVYSYQQARKGEKAETIRKAIMNGAWKTVDLTKYSTLAPSR